MILLKIIGVFGCILLGYSGASGMFDRYGIFNGKAIKNPNDEGFMSKILWVLMWLLMTYAIIVG